MKIRKTIKLISGNRVISLKKEEIINITAELKDILELDINLIAKAYKCNNCTDGIVYLIVNNSHKPTENLEQTEIVCNTCFNKQSLIDSIRYIDWFKTLKENK